jgi:hypothetical protein
VSAGTNSWTIGFALSTWANPGFQYIFSEDTINGWRAFTAGAAGAGNIRLTGASIPNVDIVGGAGDSGWVHVAWVHDTVANQVRAYLNGVLVSTVAAPTVNLVSGNTLIIGRLGVTSLLNDNWVEEFRLYDYALTAAQVASWSDNALNGRADFSKVMLSEVSWGLPDGVEITNFGTGSVNLTNWRIKWRDATGTNTSDPLNVIIAAHESIVVSEWLPLPEGIPAGTQAIDRFSNPISTSDGAITVSLLDAIGNPLDEVRITDTLGAHPGWSFGSAFRGLATRGAISGLGPQDGVERIWGLDSNGGADWTEQPIRSMGRENRSSGPRGTDSTEIAGVKINELDDAPDLIELYNPGGFVSLGGWFFLASASQGDSHTVVTIPAGTVIGPNSYVVFGDLATPPAELPVGIPYVVLGSMTWSTNALDCALYDSLGRLVDLVRAPRVNSTLVHNHPRAPSFWSDFVGAGGRNTNGGDDAMGRDAASTDTNDGGDWFPIHTRTMGSANVSTTLAGPGGHDDVYDVRLNETGLGNGFQAIMNAGPDAAGQTFNFLVSLGHNVGTGPFFGLGGDALANLATFYNVPPFSGVLDAQGSGRIDLDPGLIPPGIDADFIFVRQLPSAAVAALTYVLAFDS